MKLVFVNRFYWPDRAATAQMLQDLAEDLADAGHDVLVITSRGVYAGDDARLPRRDRHRGVEIRRVGGTRFGRGTIVGRVFDYATFLVGATWRILSARGRDVVVMTDPPLTVVPALLASKLRGARVIHWVQDLYPALPVTLGLLRGRGFLNRSYRAIAPRLHRAVRLTVALGPRMAERLRAEGAPADRLVVVDNWADATAIHPVPPSENPFLDEQGLRDKFIVLYSGNAGRGHEFGAVRQAMLALRDVARIQFLFIGGGAQMPALRRFTEEHALGNVRFLGYVPREQLRFTLPAASVSLVTEDPRVAGLLVPSKTYGILASGRPIVFLGSEESDVARIVRETDAGVVLDPFDGAAFAALLRHLDQAPDRVDRMGRNARVAAQTRYDRAIATARWAAAVTPFLR